MTALEVVRAHYAASDRGDLDGMLAPLAPDASWTEAAGSTYAGTYVGREAIVANVFQRIGAEWASFEASVAELFEAGDTVIALGAYTGVHRATGKSMTARFTHIWRVADGHVTSFEQVADTALIRGAES
ncbi:nuclear transport factor 2 family protein [Saccharothrix obliqua]|uniref:nuclear transport factor 2 family protein n=1 Tax=Saccharothrix obliqua TaxID=2861747 RepID=UPI001C5EEFCE|nr:nuclear transport factor 2 family protein [Saccharothrix obliqua]MBW4717816.1 nuclear transport factor 2 family protein [Saccharothrix obliqua]